MSGLAPFARVVDEHGPMLLRFCQAQVGSQLAEDVFQETMLAALRAYDSVREQAAIRSWLLTIAARKAIDIHRKTQAVAVADVEALVGGHADPPLADEALWEAVAALAPKQRQAIALRFVADLDYATIAQLMQTSPAAARRSVADGLARLRTHPDLTDLQPKAS